jgi:hypothetical protein
MLAENYIDISIPYEVITNRIVNTISIVPHPICGIDILTIATKVNGQWTEIPTFKDHTLYDEGLNCIPKAKPVRFIFQDIMPTDIRIVLRQTTYSSTEQYGYNSFYAGAYSINVGQIRSIGTAGEFNAEVTLDSDNNRINSITAIIDNGSICEGEFLEYELMYKVAVNGSPNLFTILPVGEDMNVPSNILIIRLKTNKINSIIPAINSVKINYTMI